MSWMPAPGRRDKLALAAIVAVFIVAGLLYSVSSPVLEVSDEVRHYAFVEYLAAGNGLPIQDPANRGFYEQEGSQPPLYYALMALLVQPFDRSDFLELAQFNPHAMLGRADTTNNWNQLIHTGAEEFPWQRTTLAIHFLRLIGIAMGAVTVACAYLLARELTGAPWLAAALAAALVAFNPMFVFISASVNNDTLATALSSLALLTGALIIRRGLTLRMAVLLGVLLGCAALSKASALALVAVIPVAIGVAEWRRGKLNLARLAVVVLLAAAIAGWWYARNQILYGDFTGTTMMASIAGPRETPPAPWQLAGEWGGFRKAYWGLFGAVNIPMDEWIYVALDAMTILACAGLALGARDWWINRAVARKQSGKELAVLMCLGVLVVAFAALIRWTSITLASQGRLLFPVIAVISTFLAWGVWRIGRRTTDDGRWLSVVRRPSSVVGLIVALAVLALACPAVYIRPAYSLPPRSEDEAGLPPDVVKAEMRFGDGIRWIGYRVDSNRVEAGGEFGVTLYWQGLQPMPADYSAFVKLYGRGDAQVANLDTYPGGGMWQTTRWAPGEVITDHYRLRITDTLTLPSVLHMDVGFWNYETKEFLPAFDAAGQPISRQRYEVAGAVPSPTPISDLRSPIFARRPRRT